MNTDRIKESISHLKIRHIWAAAGIVLILIAVSFYCPNGYYDLGEEKYYIFIRTGIAVLGGWIVCCVAGLIKDRSYMVIADRIAHFGAVEWFMVLFVVSGIISTLTGNYISVSLWGQNGWRMGLVTIAVMTGLGFMAMDLFGSGERWLPITIVYVFMAVSSVVFVIAVLNRFSIFLFYMIGQAEDFLSTLGNINWFCGYLSIFTGAGCGLFLCAESPVRKALTGVYIWLCAVTGICCGASSAYLAWGALSFAALLWALSDSERLIRLCSMEMIMLAALPFIRFMGALRPYRMWYDSALLKGITYGDTWMVPFIVGMVFFSVISEICYRRRRDRSGLRPVLVGASLGLAGAVILLIALNTLIEGGIRPIGGSSLFTWGVSWGNGRGGIWIASLNMAGRLLPLRILFGVGCDCMCTYAYSMDDISAQLTRYIGGLYLTNAHNEILTTLIDQGLVGVIAYFGLQIAHIRACARADAHPSADAQPSADTHTSAASGIILGALLAGCAYMAIGMVGFMQLLSTPFLYMLIGASTGLIKRENENIM